MRNDSQNLLIQIPKIFVTLGLNTSRFLTLKVFVFKLSLESLEGDVTYNKKILISNVSLVLKSVLKSRKFLSI
jgi:hypothetical protein